MSATTTVMSAKRPRAWRRSRRARNTGRPPGSEGQGAGQSAEARTRSGEHERSCAAGPVPTSRPPSRVGARRGSPVRPVLGRRRDDPGIDRSDDAGPRRRG
ncbi:Uncharacterised protein [Mycobacteroides abscessus]|nr:Uncharacterised protein [Mycobacteroides abscessus]